MMNRATSMVARHCKRGFLFGLAALCCTPAFADTSPALDRVSIWLGGYYANTDTEIGARDRSGQLSGHVSLEDDLGFRDYKTVPRARLDFLLGDHQGFSFDYYSLDRSHGRSISRDLNFDGNVYPASASVDGKLDFHFGSAAYRWWFGQGNDVFGLGVGAAYYEVDARVSGQASLDGETAQASAGARETAWAPMLQLGWRHAFTRNLRMYVDASGVKKNGGNLSGDIYNAALGLEWFPLTNLGVGAEYGYSRIRLDQNHADYQADLDMRLKGPSLFLRLRF